MSLICSDAGVQQKFHDKETNYWYKEDAGYFNDYNENFVVFLAD